MTISSKFNVKMALEELEEEQSITSLEDDNEISDIESSVDYASGEISKGLETIANLIDLSNKISLRENNNVSIESYNDIACLAYNNILNKIGLEDSEVSTIQDSESKEDKKSTLSEKVKSFIQKIIEAIKKIVEKIKEFFSKAFDYASNKLKAASNSLKKLKDKLEVKKYKLRGAQTIEIEKPMYFRDENNVTVDDIFDSVMHNFNVNFHIFMTKIEDYEDMLSEDPGKFDNNKIQVMPKTINDINESLLKGLKPISKSKEFGLKITSDGYIDAKIDHGKEISKIVYTVPSIDGVEKQTMINAAEIVTTPLLSRISSNFDHNLLSFELIKNSTQNSINKKIPKILNKIKTELETANQERAEFLRNQALYIKEILNQLSGISVALNRAIIDISNMVIYYNTIISNNLEKT